MPEEIKQVPEATPPEAKVEETQKEPDRLVNLEAEFRKLQENFNNQQRVITKKDIENKTLKEKLDDREAEREMQKLLIAAIAEQKGEPEQEVEETVKAKKPDLLKQYEQLDTRRKQDNLQKKVTSYQEKVEALGLTEDSPEYAKMHLFVTRLNWDKADAFMATLEEKSAKPVEPPKETRAVLTEKDEEEIARKYLEKQGKLKTDVSLPSGSGRKLTIEDVQNMSKDERAKRFKEIAGISL